MVILVCLFALPCFEFEILFKARHTSYHSPANAISYFQLSDVGRWYQMPKWVMENWQETARSNSMHVTASMAPHSYKTYLQVFTARMQRSRQDGAFFIWGLQCGPDKAQHSGARWAKFFIVTGFMAIAKWEHNQLVTFQEMAGDSHSGNHLVTGG